MSLSRVRGAVEDSTPCALIPPLSCFGAEGFGVGGASDGVGPPVVSGKPSALSDGNVPALNCIRPGSSRSFIMCSIISGDNLKTRARLIRFADVAPTRNPAPILAIYGAPAILIPIAVVNPAGDP